MNKHYFKRILESIITRKKDSVLIFFIIFILSFFVIVSICISRLGSNISESVKTDMEIKTYINGLDFDDLNTGGYANLINSTFQNIDYHFDNYCKENDCIYNSTYNTEVYSDVSSYEEEMDNDFKENFTLFSASSYDTFTASGLSLIDGDYFKDNERYSILVNDGSFLYLNGVKIKVGDVIDITINNLTYNFQVIGTFVNKGNASVINKESYYNLGVNMIINRDDFFEICNEANRKVTSNCLGIKAVDGHRFEKLKKDFQRELNDAINEKRIIDKVKNYNIETNENEYNKIVSPSDNLKKLYNIISIVMVLISCLLLVNVVTFLNENRLKEYAVLLAMGQNKTLSILSFAIEILLIAFLAITLSLPLGIKVAKSSADTLLENNLKRQERLAKISKSEEDFDVFEKQLDLYSKYEVEIENIDIVFIYVVNDIFILISCLFVFVSIQRLKPRELLLKGK